MIQTSNKLRNIQSGVLLQSNHKWRLIPDGKEEWDLVMSSWELRHRHICSQNDSLKLCLENFLKSKIDLQQHNFGWKRMQRREGVHTVPASESDDRAVCSTKLLLKLSYEHCIVSKGLFHGE